MTVNIASRSVRLARDAAGMIPLKFANRHGLIAGATGSGKTVTLMRLAEEFGAAGVPVILTDVKGDAARLIGTMRKALPVQRVTSTTYPTPLYALGFDVFSRMIGASAAQTAALWAMIEDSRLTTIADLIAAIEAAPQALVTTGTRQALVRYLKPFDGSPSFGSGRDGDLSTLLAAPVVTVLDVQSLAADPAAYGATMTWLLRRAYEGLPEVGDLDKPKLAIIIDEAHTLFRRMNADTLDEFARVMRLIRSRGVGVYFATQDPTDVPDVVSQQLGVRVLHAMRPGNPKLAGYFRSLYRGEGLTIEGLYNMRPGEAIMGGMDAAGGSTPMQRVMILKPAVQLNAPIPVEPVAEDEPRPVLPAIEGRAFGRKRPYGAAPTRVAYREMLAAAEDAGRARATLIVLALALASALAITGARWVKPSPEEAVTVVKLLRGSATFLLMAAGLALGVMALLPMPVVLKNWLVRR